jgi:hypothetical protein
MAKRTTSSHKDWLDKNEPELIEDYPHFFTLTLFLSILISADIILSNRQK